MAWSWSYISVQFSSVHQSCPTLCDPMNCSTPGLPVHHQLPEFTQTHVHWVSDAIQPSHPLSSPSPPAPNPSQHQSLFQWVNSSHEVAKELESQLYHHSFQRNPRADLLQNRLVGSQTLINWKSWNSTNTCRHIQLITSDVFFSSFRKFYHRLSVFSWRINTSFSYLINLSFNYNL